MNPSLNAIRTFEAAARHLSFARAARDLAVQPPAVSRKVAELEQQLGVSLFVRSKPRLSLTWQGEALFQSVQRGLDQIQQGCNAVRRQNDQTSLRVLTSIGMAQCWLLARLNGFYQRYPEVDLQLTTRDSTANLDIVGADITITFDDEDEKTKSASCIFYDNIIAISSAQSMTKKRMLTVSELADQHLLHYLEPMQLNDWRLLFNSVGVDPPPVERGSSFNSYVVYLQASLNGDGVAIGSEHLLEDYLRNGSLRRVADLRLETRRGYFCHLTPEGRDKPAAHQFREWICSLIQTKT